METRRFDELGATERGNYIKEYAAAVMGSILDAADAVDRHNAQARRLYGYICGYGDAPELPRRLTDAEVFGWDEVKS